ncbi:MAG: type II toxin-antitoxin system RelE/ParE family toxin [Chitinivibrionales bacterium]|nr:type II toxin-antitoxin system RelE/ParE family toxin [Chitinivibrionales bacterium]
MAEVIWAERAYEHLEQIAEYIQKDSPFQANRVVRIIINETHRLHDNIRIGHEMPEMHNDWYRELKAFSYRILYKILNEDKVAIIGIVHSRRVLDLDMIN